jgi:GNAT superfamily N-acetyltransferase
MSHPPTPRRRIPRERVRIVNIRPEYAAALEQLQRDCFPTLGAQELMRQEHFLSHCEIFPEGNFVALVEEEDGAERVVGLGSGFFIDFDFDHPDHTFMEIIDGGYFRNHNPDGAYYYGADISVHPDYRGQGIGRMLYEARKGVVQAYNRKGIVGGGVLPGYVAYKDHMTVKEYVELVISNTLVGKTLRFQLNNGFVVLGLIPEYLEDSASDNWATLIFWPNPEYRGSGIGD